MARLSSLCAAIAVWCWMVAPAIGEPLPLTAGDLTLPVGSNGTLNVTWTSNQALNYLNTQFVLRAVTGSSGGAVFTEVSTGTPPMPPITDSNYVFFGNSSAVTAGGNPASVGTDAWAGDSYFLTDATDNGLDYLQDGSRLWTTLDITGITAGTYQLHLLSSEYDFASSGGTAVPLTDADLSGGLVTVTSGGGVPEIDPAGGAGVVSFVAATLALIERGRRGRQSAVASW